MKAFLKLVEIQTKLASQLPLLLGTGYILYYFDVFKPLNFLFLFISLLTFDMATTAINNYYDYKKSVKTSGYGYEEHNAIVYFSMKEGQVRFIILTLLLMATIFGVLLYLNTSVVVLLLGMLSFAVGIVYSFGPVPISRTPFGELFSGGVMGFIIPFLAVYVHVYDFDLVGLGFEGGTVYLSLDMPFVIRIFLLTITPMVCIANIMLANNICDMEDDIVNKRYTLPLYIGKERALKLFKWLYFVAYGSILIMIMTKMLPLISLIAMVTLLPVMKNIGMFGKEQQKRTTFVLAVKNLLIIVGTLTITLYAAVVMKLFL